MKIVIAAGGTGGHLFPAQALAEKLKANMEVLFVGAGLTKNPFFNASSHAFLEIEAASLSGKKPAQLISSLKRLSAGYFESLKLLRHFSPDLVVGFGSFHTFPVLLAAWRGNVPFVLHEANAIPGKVNRFFSGKARATITYFPETKSHLKGRVMEARLPLREGYERLPSKEEARRYFGLAEDRKVVLVFGGSQGALAINQLVRQVIEEWGFDFRDVQWLHFTGSEQAARHLQPIYAAARLKAVVKPFEARMEYAWRASDLAITRSGAASIAEQLAVEVPAILIPYPHATEDHQLSNANFMVHEVKGGLKFLEKELTPAKLHQTLKELVIGDSAREQLQGNIQRFKKKVTLPAMEELVLELL